VEKHLLKQRLAASGPQIATGCFIVTRPEIEVMKLYKKLIAALSLGLVSVASMADPVSYSSTFEGTTFKITQLDSDSLRLEILGALSSTGTWANAVAFDNFALKDIGTGITGGNVTPGTWAYSPLELNASGCGGGASGGVCFDANPSILLTDNMVFQIDLSFASGYALNIASAGPHLKVRFVDGNGRKVGSLLSANIGSTTVICDLGPACNDDDLTTVPEPGSLALVGAALLAAGWGSRRRVRTANA
jgi:hypothetical protein